MDCCGNSMALHNCNNVSVSDPGNGNVSVSDEIQITIEELKRQVEPILTPTYCIYQVPEILRKGNKDAYTPHLISIGPMHHKNPNLKAMEERKILYLYHFRERTNATEEVLKECKSKLEGKENEIRNCYSGKFPPLKTDEFVHMILLDAIFIMELFWRNAEKKNDYLLTKPVLRKEIERDLLLAENQLPFSVLKVLYKDLEKQDHEKFLELACNYFEAYNPQPVKSAKDINQKNLLKTGWDHPKHFTDLIRSFHISHRLTLERNEALDVKDAKKLKSSGIIFKPVSDKGLLDLKFTRQGFLNCCNCCLSLCCAKAQLLFPKLKVTGSTEYELRNLMAFEQFHYPNDNYICSYAFLLGRLIRDENDAAVLVESGVIDNKLSSEKELTQLMNKLCENIVINTHCFGEISEELNKHYNYGCNKNIAALRLVYFSNLWKGTGTVVGLLVLLITVINFIRSNIHHSAW